jgi:hypothetical protein
VPLGPSPRPGRCRSSAKHRATGALTRRTMLAGHAAAAWSAGPA